MQHPTQILLVMNCKAPQAVVVMLPAVSSVAESEEIIAVFPEPNQLTYRKQSISPLLEKVIRQSTMNECLIDVI
jgi:septum formation inhibitor-activating ATPase MinD